MKTTRKRYSADFKAKVALEAIRGDLTLAELAAKHGVHHTMIAAWKRQAIDGIERAVFEPPKRDGRMSSFGPIAERLLSGPKALKRTCARRQ